MADTGARRRPSGHRARIGMKTFSARFRGLDIEVSNVQANSGRSSNAWRWLATQTEGRQSANNAIHSCGGES